MPPGLLVAGPAVLQLSTPKVCFLTVVLVNGGMAGVAVQAPSHLHRGLTNHDLARVVRTAVRSGSSVVMLIRVRAVVMSITMTVVSLGFDDLKVLTLESYLPVTLGALHASLDVPIVCEVDEVRNVVDLRPLDGLA